MSEAAAVARAGRPATIASLRDDLARLGVAPGMEVLVHSSLSALGWVSGGAVAVIMALQAAVGAAGTLLMPAFSGDLSDPAQWRNPPVPEAWWATIRETLPAFDPDVTPTRGMGAVADTFRRGRDVWRSLHPQVSFAARGPAAAALLDGHALAYGLGEGSPLARLYDRDGWVVLLGVGHGNNTSLHLAECRATFPGKRTEMQGSPLLVDGRREWVTFPELDYDDDDFPTIGAAFEAETGLARVGPVGAGTARLMPQRPLVDFAVGWMEKNRG